MKNITISLRITEDEKETLEVLSASYEMSISEYIRLLINNRTCSL